MVISTCIWFPMSHSRGCHTGFMYLSTICVLSFGKRLLSLVAHLLIGLFVPLARTFWVLSILSITCQVSGWQRFCAVVLVASSLCCCLCWLQKHFNWGTSICHPLLSSFSHGSPILEAIAYASVLKVSVTFSSRSFKFWVLNSCSFEMNFV